MVAHAERESPPGTRGIESPENSEREGIGMSPENNPWKTRHALLLRSRRVWCPRYDRGIAAEWTWNSRELGRGQFATVSSPRPRSVHEFVRGVSEAVDYPQPQTCPQSFRELATDSAATWLSPRPRNSRALSAERSRKGQGVSAQWPSGCHCSCPGRFLSLSAGRPHQSSRHVLV